jgi:hypothetical protein
MRAETFQQIAELIPLDEPFTEHALQLLGDWQETIEELQASCQL